MLSTHMLLQVHLIGEGLIALRTGEVVLLLLLLVALGMVVKSPLASEILWAY